MKLFRKHEKRKACCSGGNSTPASMYYAVQGKKGNGLKILGSGCAKCVALENAARTAISEMALNIELQHITDFAQIASYGVMTTPALVLDGNVVSYGKVLSVEEIKTILDSHRSIDK